MICEYFRKDRGQPSSISRKREKERGGRGEISPSLRMYEDVVLKCSSILPPAATRSSMRRRRAMSRIFRNILPAWRMHRRSGRRSRLFSHGDWIRRSKLHFCVLSTRARAWSLSTEKTKWSSCSLSLSFWNSVCVLLDTLYSPYRRWSSTAHINPAAPTIARGVLRSGRDSVNVVYITDGGASPKKRWTYIYSDLLLPHVWHIIYLLSFY